MEAFKNNFIFILWTGWIIWGIATFVIGGYTFIEDEDGEHPFHKYRLIAWIAVAVFWIIMFILQNIYIYLY